MDDLSREGAYNHVPEHAGPTAKTLGRISWVFSLIALGLVFMGLYGIERESGPRGAVGAAEAEASATDTYYASVSSEAAAPATGAADFNLTGGARSMDDLGASILHALGEADQQALADLQVTRNEFQELLRPEFSESRPDARIPPAEAWRLHSTKSANGLAMLLKGYGNRNLALEGITVDDVRPFAGFTMYEGVTLHVVDRDTGETANIRNVSAVVERKGRFKIYMAES